MTGDAPSPLLRLDVPELLTRLGITAQKAYKKWRAPCPNPEHRDKSPSWFIRDQPGEKYHGAHKCMSCGFAGGPILLVQTILGMGFEHWSDAREWLLDVAKPPPFDPSAGYQLLGYGVKSRIQPPEGTIFEPFEDWIPPPAIYLRKRGVEPGQADRWGLGYVPAHAKSKYAGRIVVPFRDAAGSLLAWTARAWSPHESKRYLEPDPGDNADPHAIFGESRWPELLTRDVVVVEGWSDALAAERAVGDQMAVGALVGSSPTPAQLDKLVSRFDRIVVVEDPNPAGRSVGDALLAIRRHVDVVAVTSPDGMDPGKMGETDGGLMDLRAMILGAFDEET